jgi:hypothetical protein
VTDKERIGNERKYKERNEEGENRKRLKTVFHVLKLSNIARALPAHGSTPHTSTEESIWAYTGLRKVPPPPSLMELFGRHVETCF